MANKPPVKEIKFGLVKASIWENHSKAGQHFTVSIVRLYRDGPVWRSSKVFSRDELMLLAKAADHAHTWICEQGQHRRNEATDQQ